MPVPVNQLVFPREGDLFRVWGMNDIYHHNSNNHPGRHVPKIDDLIRDRVEGFFIVTDVDMSTGEATWVKWSPLENVDTSNENVLLGSGPGLIAESYRIFVDTSVTPHTLSFDSRLHIYGSTCESVKVFLGSDIGPTGIVVSGFLNQSQQLVSESIPLEVVASPGQEVTAIKTPKVGICNRPLVTGEQCTVVVYDSVGGVRSKALIIVENTAVTRNADASALYITDLYLKSAFLSETDASRIEYPANVTVDSNHLRAVVRYNNGHSVELPIDSGKANLLGIQTYIPTVPGQRIPVTLSYRLDPNETTNGVIPVNENGYIVVPYELVTVEAKNAYSVKLFAYPKWIDSVYGYRMEYWLYVLERDQYFYATPFVSHGPNTPAFDPTAYGTVQHLTLVVNLEQVNSVYFDAYRHVQPVTVTLHQRGDQLVTPNWTIAFNPGQNPQYGTKAVAKMTYQNINTSLLDISCNAANIDEWLNLMYYQTFPLYSPSQENAPLVPNFVQLQFGDNELEISVNQWNTVLSVDNDLTQGQLLYARFIRRDDNGDKQLAIAGLPVHQTV